MLRNIILRVKKCHRQSYKMTIILIEIIDWRDKNR